MDPEHDRQVRVRRRAGRTCDAKVEAVELRLLQRLVGDAVLGEVEKLLFDAFEFWLGADGPEKDSCLDLMSTSCDMNTYPCREQSVSGG